MIRIPGRVEMSDQVENQDQFTPELSPIVEQAGDTPIRITVVNYNREAIIEKEHKSAKACQDYLTNETCTWIHVQGQPKPSVLREFGEYFTIHPLALEDVINTGERAKKEAYDDQIMLILGILNKKGTQIINEQTSFILGDNFLVTFHNGESDPFRAVRRRLHHPKAALRTRQLDYLLYVLVDVVIDHCFPILDEFEDEIEEVEQQLFSPSGIDTYQALYTIKRELLVLRLKLHPQREAILLLMRDESNILSEDTKIYLRDCYDHIVRLTDMLEIYRDMTSNMLDVHLSLVNKKTFISNEVQRKATVWAVIFAPMTFITGIYGMNFTQVPEFDYHYGFISSILGMMILGIILALIFKRKNWL